MSSQGLGQLNRAPGRARATHFSLLTRECHPVQFEHPQPGLSPHQKPGRGRQGAHCRQGQVSSPRGHRQRIKAWRWPREVAMVPGSAGKCCQGQCCKCCTQHINQGAMEELLLARNDGETLAKYSAMACVTHLAKECLGVPSPDFDFGARKGGNRRYSRVIRCEF